MRVLRFLPLALLVACSSAASPAPAPPAPEPPVEEGTTPPGEEGTTPPVSKEPRSCDPLTARDPAPKLLIGPKDFEKTILDAIGGAKKSVRILIYEIERTTVENALIAAKKRGLEVQLVVDKSKSAPAKTRLRAAGVDVKDSPAELVFQHAKVVLVDDETAIILSGNFNAYTFEGERNYGVIDRDASDVADVRKIFERDYAGSGPLDLPCTKLVVSPINARARIEQLVKSAKTSLDLSVMYVTDKNIAAAVKERRAAGVNVRLLLANPAWMDSNAATASEMAAAQVSVRYYKKLDLHAKLIIADGVAFVGSENMSKNSLDNNREIGIFATEKDVTAGIQAQYELDWAAGESP